MNNYIIKGVVMDGEDGLKEGSISFKLQQIDDDILTSTGAQHGDTGKIKGRFISTAVSDYLLEERECRFVEFNKNIVLQLLAQRGCKGLRFYFCDRIAMPENAGDAPKKVEGELSLIIEPYGQGKHYDDCLSRRLTLKKGERTNGNKLMRAEIGGIGGNG